MRSRHRLAAPLAALLASACGCPEGQTDCQGVCRDLQIDVRNCGACGTACKAGELCNAGKCALSCQAGLTDCTGTCRDLQSDLANCGACGTKCAAGEVCSAGKCSTSCKAGLTDCTGSCRDLQTDVANCGACAAKCDAGKVCSTGKCAVSCLSGLTDCSGSCVNTMTDRANCGACGSGCKSGEVCDGGRCSVSCQMGLSDCGGSCRDLQSDASNCGSCGTKCDAGKVCAAGSCSLTCLSGLTVCSGYCRDLQTDRQSCGACDTACKAGEICSAGKCSLSCQAGLDNCSGVCTNLQTDLSSCGACGKACPGANNATLTCVKAVCGFTCNKDFLDCNKAPADGCEAASLTDLQNCGGCGKACGAVANGQPACVSGACAIGSCTTGWADCNKTLTDGCEADTRVDAKNCGSCGKVCDAGNYCVAGKCVLPASCMDLKKAGVKTDGKYSIDPDGAGAGAAIAVWCDMTTDGGGFTVCARQSFAGNSNYLGASQLGTTWGTVDGTNTFGVDCATLMRTVRPSGKVEFALKGSEGQWSWLYPFDTESFYGHVKGSDDGDCNGGTITECRGSATGGVTVSINKRAACHNYSTHRTSDYYFIYQFADSTNSNVIMEIGQGDGNHPVGIRADCGTSGWWGGCGQPGGTNRAYAIPNQCGTSNRSQGMVEVMFRER